MSGGGRGRGVQCGFRSGQSTPLRLWHQRYDELCNEQWAPQNLLNHTAWADFVRAMKYLAREGLETFQLL